MFFFFVSFLFVIFLCSQLILLKYRKLNTQFKKKTAGAIKNGKIRQEIQERRWKMSIWGHTILLQVTHFSEQSCLLCRHVTGLTREPTFLPALSKSTKLFCKLQPIQTWWTPSLSCSAALIHHPLLHSSTQAASSHNCTDSFRGYE